MLIRTVFDTTHPLTQGVVERKVIQQDDDEHVTVEAKDCLNNTKYLHCNEWEFNLETAIRIAEKKKTHKINQLKKQIEKLESTPIKIVRLGY